MAAVSSTYVRRKRTLDQRKTPYFDALMGYVKDGTVSFHTPGHKHGAGMHERLRDFLGSNVLKFDLTQVQGLDDLNAPHGPIAQAQALAAAAYGADASYFLINGSTAGNQAMFMSSLRPDDMILLGRNSHKSATSALIMSGAVPVYMQPEVDARLHIDHCVTVDTVRKALDAHPSAKAVFVTSPTYYGATADLAAIEHLVHARDKLLLVDEAWGPHLHFHPELPISATAARADMCVNSTHKLIAGMSQGAMLHTLGERVDTSRLRSTLPLLQSTSPLLVMLASLDVARMQMATQGETLLTQTLQLAREARVALTAIGGASCLGPECIGMPGVAGYDETRLVITLADRGYTGYELSDRLRTHYDVQVEMADLFNVVALVTIGDRRSDLERLTSAVAAIAKERRPSLGARFLQKRQKRENRLPGIPEQVATPREAFVATHVEIDFHASAGYVSAEVVTPYPPGIPVLCPGERITQETVEYIRLEQAAGVHIAGPADEQLRTIRVLASHQPHKR